MASFWTYVSSGLKYNATCLLAMNGKVRRADRFLEDFCLSLGSLLESWWSRRCFASWDWLLSFRHSNLTQLVRGVRCAKPVDYRYECTWIVGSDHDHFDKHNAVLNEVLSPILRRHITRLWQPGLVVTGAISLCLEDLDSEVD